MPGNEVGDRVHNFFEQEHLSQGQHHSQTADGNWAVVNNNLRIGNQRQFDALSPKIKDYSPQQSDLERARTIHSRQMQHGLNSSPPVRPELAKNRSHNQHLDLNGYIYGHQVSQTRPDEANLLGMGIESDWNNSIGRGFSINGQSQGSGPEHPATSMRMDSFESPVSYDFFGGQPKVSEHPGMRQSLPEQQSGFGDMQQLQQHLMFRKMKELQRQQDFQQLHASQQHSVNQVPSFTRQVSGNHSHEFVNGTPVSDASHPWNTELPTGNTNWLHQASSAMQESTGGLMFSPGYGQASHLVNLAHQQVDQSLPGVPISSLKDNYRYQFANNQSLQQMATYNNSFQGNQYAAFPEQVNTQDEHVNSRQSFQGKKLFGHTSHQGPSSRINMENFEQLSPMEKNVATQEFHEKQEIVGPSEKLRDKIVGQAPSSQNSIALDPAEKKILFGSDDDSIWDAFGKKTVMNGGASNLLDETEFMNGLPSIQSGSWSALMQSAVAETSSSDVGLQEDWTNLSIQNPDLPTGNHQSSTYDAGKHHTPLIDNNLPISSAFTFESVAPSDDTNLKNNYHNNAQGFPQTGQKMSQEHIKGLQNNASHRPIQPSPAGGGNWLNSGKQSYGSHSVDAGMNGRRYINHRGPPQNGPSQPSKAYNSSITNSVTPNGDMPFDNRENGNHVQNSQKNGQKRDMHESLNLKDGIWKVDSISNSTAELEQPRFTTGSSLEGSSLNAAGAALNSTKSRAGEEANFLDRWKPMEASVKTKESEHSRKSEHLLKKGPQLVESTFHSSEKFKMHEMDTFSEKENHNASYRCNVSNHNFTAGSRETDLSNASDSQSLSGGNQKFSNQVSRKSAGPRKFQYHPMGNLDEDVEPFYQMRQANLSNMMPLHNSQGFRNQDEGFFGQSKLFGQFPKGSIGKGKGQLPDHQGDTNRLDEVSFRASLPGYGPEVSSDLNKSDGMSASNKASHSSENMLELLHKVDQSKERITVMHHTSTGYSPLSQTPEAESSDGIGGCLHQNQSSLAQGFGLQLAPPSQKGPGLKQASSSPSQTVNYSSSTQATGVKGDKGQRMLDPTTLCQSLPSPHEKGEGECKNNTTVIPGQTAIEASLHKMQENFSSDSNFPYPRSQLQDQLMPKASRQVLIDSHSRLSGQFSGNYVLDAAGSAPYDNAASSLNISGPTPVNYLHDRASAEHISAGEMSVSQTITTTGISQKGAFPKMLSNIWPDVPPQQRFVGDQGRHALPKPIQSHQSDNVESTFRVPQNLEDHDPSMDYFPSELGTGSLHLQGLVCEKEQLGKENSCQQVSSGNKDLVRKTNESLRKEPGIQQRHHASPLNPPSTQRDIEAFGRSLQPNNFIQQNFSLTNQIRAMRNLETDPSNRGSKRLKGPKNILLGEQVTSRSGQPSEADAMVEDAPFPSVDPKMHRFSETEDYGGMGALSSETGKLPSQHMLVFDQIESENFRHGSSTAVVRTEHPNISPHMAPSWFNQYGSFKNGQMLQLYDARKAVTLKNDEQPFKQSCNNLHTESLEHMNVAADTSEISNKQQNEIPALLAIEHLVSLQSLRSDNACENLVVSRPKKRKCAIFELQSWQKEVSHSCQGLQSLRVAEANWAEAAKRLSEKVEDDVDTIEDGLPMPRARRRLSLTRQLMQLLFPAPPAVILSAEASSNYETVAYFVARQALGDTCSLTSCPESHSDSPSIQPNLQADKRKTSDNREQHTSQVMEDFIGRVRKLETELLRPDKKASVSDLRIEVQDVEKISIINRFAMFHSRLQADGADTSSLHGATANSQKPCPQRFVTAVPLPRNLPDNVLCLSL